MESAECIGGDSEKDSSGTTKNSSTHEYFMKKALQMGENALATGETPVGCVLVHNGKIIGSGMNDTNKSMNGTRHAEFLAIEEVLENHPRSIFRETDLYVTVEPCIMCASLLRQYHIRGVYFGCGNERFGGTGSVLSLHSDPGIDPPYPAHGGLFRKEAIMLLRRFYIQENVKGVVVLTFDHFAIGKHRQLTSRTAPKPKPKKNRDLNTDFDDDEENEGGNLIGVGDSTPPIP